MYADNEYDRRLWMTLIEANIPKITDRHQCEFVDDASHPTYHSVLDKWLERLDLHDSKDSSYAETLVGYASPPLISPTLRACQSSESLESGCSSEQATLSSSAGSVLAADLNKAKLKSSLPQKSLRRAITTATDKKALSRSLPLSVPVSLSAIKVDSDRERSFQRHIVNRSSIASDPDIDSLAYEVFSFEDEGSTPSSPYLNEHLPPCLPPPTTPLPPLPGLLQRIGENGSISLKKQ
ncbi:hypothetical protein EC973_004931 [Apophysomyces ossiformis]|uniref:PH domain-containing protein n=1 Tax=Apophysomyces ossiformis TaxID=679940 RepID=A0A8H7EUU9_9FUNG|nr:hypothetical protein EC973_004931 [Apophysomyces ossiformis]